MFIFLKKNNPQFHLPEELVIKLIEELEDVILDNLPLLNKFRRGEINDEERNCLYNSLLNSLSLIQLVSFNLDNEVMRNFARGIWDIIINIYCHKNGINLEQ